MTTYIDGRTASSLTLDRLKELLQYDPHSGVFTRRIKVNRFRAGSVAGSLQVRGYVRISIDGTSYAAHRLAFLWMTGHFPAHEVDHRDGNRSNNAWDNLREATHSQNMQNKAPRVSSETGLLGVTRDRGRWRAQIWANGALHYLGRFDTPEGAHQAYRDAKAKLHAFQPEVRA